MKRRTWLFAAAVAVLVAGCSMDPGKQLQSNEQFRTQVMSAIVKNPQLATQVVDKMLGSDSLRYGLVDHLLQNEDVAKQVIVRIGTNPRALDLVLSVAARDSAMRDHLETLLKGMQMASPHH